MLRIRARHSRWRLQRAARSRRHPLPGRRRPCPSRPWLEPPSRQQWPGTHQGGVLPWSCWPTSILAGWPSSMTAGQWCSRSASPWTGTPWCSAPSRAPSSTLPPGASSGLLRSGPGRRGRARVGWSVIVRGRDPTEGDLDQAELRAATRAAPAGLGAGVRDRQRPDPARGADRPPDRRGGVTRRSGHGNVEITRETFDERDYARFAERLEQGLSDLGQLLARPGFGAGPVTVGAELELCLVDDVARPLLAERGRPLPSRRSPDHPGAQPVQPGAELLPCIAGRTRFPPVRRARPRARRTAGPSESVTAARSAPPGPESRWSASCPLSMPGPSWAWAR